MYFKILLGVPLWHSKLSIWCCHCRGSGHCCDVGSIPGPGTSTCPRCGQKKMLLIVFSYVLYLCYTFYSFYCYLCFFFFSLIFALIFTVVMCYCIFFFVCFFFVLFCFVFLSFAFLGPNPWHMEVSRLGV